MMVLGTALRSLSCFTASTKRACSSGVHTRRGRFRALAEASSPSSPPTDNEQLTSCLRPAGGTQLKLHHPLLLLEMERLRP